MRPVELVGRSDAAPALPAAAPDVEVERSVRDRLYGQRGAITATRIAHGAAPLGRLFGGRYRLVERLGAGGMATVYRARDEQLERAVAVKVIGERHARDPSFLRPFRWEAQLGARLSHPNIVAVLDAGAQPRDFIVTELVRGLDAATQALAPEPDARQESAAAFRAQLLDGHVPSREPWRGGVVPFPDAVRSQVRSAA